MARRDISEGEQLEEAEEVEEVEVEEVEVNISNADEGEQPEENVEKYPADYFFTSHWYTHRAEDLEVLKLSEEYSFAEVEALINN